jgi:hypothetical protein
VTGGEESVSAIIVLYRVVIRRIQSVPCTWTKCLRVDLDSGQERVGSSSSERRKSPVGVCR